jgi:adenosylmethionine-8-amino-7-oxononanoate aminotransferase
MGNALACAAANASLDLFEREPRMAQIKAISEQMARELAACRGLPGVKDVRVKGAIGVVELDRIGDLDALRARFVEAGVFIRPFGNVIYLTPSFTIAPDDLSKLTAAITKALQTNP